MTSPVGNTPPEMPPHVVEAVKAIALLHAEHHRTSKLSERIVDRITGIVGRPSFLILLVAVASLWAAANVMAQINGVTPPDPPPFAWMDLVCTLIALLIAVLILISQRHADRLANLREQMTLESTLLTEQKTRKIIELIEELRRDSPEVADRVDPEAEQMAMKSDPHTVLNAIDETMAAVLDTANHPARANSTINDV